MNEQSHTPSAARSFVADLLRFALIAIVIVLPIRLFVAQPFIVNGASMAPTFHSGEYLIVDQLSYYFEDPQRGEVVVFRYPRNPDTFFIKRVIGLPGETVAIADGEVTIYNDTHPNGTHLDEPYLDIHGAENLRVTLADDEYFVLGDNRTESSDSRRWGPLHERFIQGRPLVRLLPLDAVEAFPGTK